MPRATPDVPPAEWALSPDGVVAAQALAASLPGDARLVSSAEPKAFETLGGGPAGVVRDPRFNEVGRPAEPWSDDFREVRRAYVEGAEHAGWEPLSEVSARFEAGVSEHLAISARRPLVIASHGMAMTCWLVHRGIVARADAGEFWSGLRFPDAHLIGPDGVTVRRG